MSDESYLQIRNWKHFQHYAESRFDRPPWIKFYSSTLDNADLIGLSIGGRLLANLLLLVAARTGNRIPDSARIVAGYVQMPTRTVKIELEKLCLIGFVERCYMTDAEREIAQTGQERLFVSRQEATGESRPRARPRAREEAEAEEELRTGNAKRTEGPRDALPHSNHTKEPNHDVITERLVTNACRDHPQSVGVLQAACANHTEHALARALESLLGRRPRPTNPPGYVINTLRSIAAENGHHPGTKIHRPPADF